MLGVGAQRLGHLDAELAGRRQHDRLGVLGVGVEVLEQRQAEGGRLAGPGLRLADHVVAGEQLGDRLLLDRRRLGVAELVEREQDLLAEAKVRESGHRSRVEQQLALGPAPGEVLVGAARLRKRVDVSDDDLELARGDRARAGRRSSPRPRSRCGTRCMSQKPITRARVAQQVAGRDLVRLARGDPEDDVTAERGQRAQAGLEGRPAGHLEHRVDLAPSLASRIASPRSLGARVDRRVGAEPLGQLALLVGRRERDRPAPPPAWRAARRASRCRPRPPGRRPSRRAAGGRTDARARARSGPGAGGPPPGRRRPRRGPAPASAPGPRPSPRSRPRRGSRRPGGRPASSRRSRPRESAAGSARRGSRCGSRACRRS